MNNKMIEETTITDESNQESERSETEILNSSRLEGNQMSINSGMILEYNDIVQFCMDCRENPESLGHLREQMVVNESVNAYQQAIVCARKLTIAIPNCSDYHYKLGTLLYTAGLYQDAILPLERALALTDKQTFILDKLGETFLKIQDYQNAIRAYTAICIQDRTYFFKLATIYVDLHNYHAAIDCYNNAIFYNIFNPVTQQEEIRKLINSAMNTAEYMSDCPQMTVYYEKFCKYSFFSTHEKNEYLKRIEYVKTQKPLNMEKLKQDLIDAQASGQQDIAFLRSLQIYYILIQKGCIDEAAQLLESKTMQDPKFSDIPLVTAMLYTQDYLDFWRNANRSETLDLDILNTIKQKLDKSFELVTNYCNYSPFSSLGLWIQCMLHNARQEYGELLKIIYCRGGYTAKRPCHTLLKPRDVYSKFYEIIALQNGVFVDISKVEARTIIYRAIAFAVTDMNSIWDDINELKKIKLTPSVIKIHTNLLKSKIKMDRDKSSREFFLLNKELEFLDSNFKIQ